MALAVRRSETDSKGAFSAWEGERHAGEMTYSRLNPSVIIVDHTEVLAGFEGKGVGKQLVARGVEWAREHGQKIMPLCPFARKVFERTPEYADVWFK
jgi:predicted GNAT family acetyltransferase